MNEQFSVLNQSTSIKVNTLGGIVIFIILIMLIAFLIYCKRYMYLQAAINGTLGYRLVRSGPRFVGDGIIVILISESKSVSNGTETAKEKFSAKKLSLKQATIPNHCTLRHYHHQNQYETSLLWRHNWSVNGLYRHHLYVIHHLY